MITSTMLQNSRKYHIITVFIILGCFTASECKRVGVPKNIEYHAFNCRKHTALLTDFGGVGDGKTLNTKAFQSAIDHLGQHSSDGGSMLIVPPGKWLTGNFNLTSSHFTLYIHKDAVVLGSRDEADYPLVPPLPSYGRGREAPGERFISLIFGTNLTDIVITGSNGTIDGQGAPWWDKFAKKKLKYTRPSLIEIMHSEAVQLSNITLINSPFWNVHPVYCRTVVIQGLTIIAPVEVPNTDGVDPDSSQNVRIEDCYIVSGDDCIAIKSGWDEYGIRYGMPSKHLIIRRLTCTSPHSPAIALGSEMSGGIQDVRAEDMTLINTEAAVRIKTAPGRGGFVKDVFVQRVRMGTMKYVFWMTGDYGDHPDNHYDPKALPVVRNINYRDMVASDVNITSKLEGISGDPFSEICISNVTVSLAENHPKGLQWNCTNVEGTASRVTPKPCLSLPDKRPKSFECPFPQDKLPIEDVHLRACTIKITSL